MSNNTTIEGAVNGAALTLFIPRNRGAAEAGNPRGTRRALPSDRRPHRAGEKQGMGGRGWRGGGAGEGEGCSDSDGRVCMLEREGPFCSDRATSDLLH